MIGDMIDHVGIYGSRVAEGLSASNVGLVFKMWFHFLRLFTLCAIFLYETGPIEWMFSQHCGYWWPSSIRASVATVLTTHPCVSRCLRINPWPSGIVFAYVCVMYVCLSVCVCVSHKWVHVMTVLQKMQNPGSPNGPPIVDGWVARFSSGWSVNQ